MKKFIIILSVGFMTAFIGSCGSNTGEENAEDAATQETSSTSTENGNPSYDPKRGEGKFTTVDIGTTLDAAMAASGEKAPDVKCMSCHKLTDERLVGPGWKGVTERRTAVWLMNFITNPDPMIDKDPEVQAQLELCLVRMPNQGLTDDEARHIVEFMRQNDGVK
jgi:hypothetical protein